MSDEFTERAKNIAKAEVLLKTMSHHQRLLILCVLGEKELNVSEIVDLTGISQSTVSQHLQRLRLEKLVTFRKDGKNVIYCLDSPVALDLIHVLHKYYCEN